MKYKLILGDCLEKMQRIKDNYIDMVLTSPPYDNLRSYKGYSFDFKNIAKQLYRVLKPGGVVVWVVGDATIKGSETGTSFKQALYFKEIGFNLHDTMIYESEKPPLTHRRYEQKFEYMFIFSKSKPKTFNSITEDCIWAGTRSDRPKQTSASAKEHRAIRPRNEKKRFVGDKKIKGNIWKYETGGNASSKDSIAFNHPAIFPEKLARDHITTWSNPGDVILDPMAGSGTTLKIALQLKRRCIAIEISKEYCKIIKERMKL